MLEIDLFRNEIKDIMMNNILYKTLSTTDSLPKQKWFGKNKKCYTENINIELIIKEINFIKSLIK